MDNNKYVIRIRVGCTDYSKDISFTFGIFFPKSGYFLPFYGSTNSIFSEVINQCFLDTIHNRSFSDLYQYNYDMLVKLFENTS
jgi:hypothetical protein